MAEFFIGEVRMMSFGFPPKGWAQCNGQLMAIAQNQALFSLLGTMYGGDGRTTFGLPNLQGRAATHRGGSMAQGQAAGEAAHTLIATEIPAHTHTVNASSAAAGSPVPTGNVLASAANVYGGPTSLTTLRPGTLAPAGGSQPHSNLQPYTVINFCIALTGQYPSRS